MPLSPGDKLGPYEILALIGKGGMGEVYRARDPRLKRDVAIKVSAAQFSERFEREATAIAALNHANICQIYDVGPNYLVMEFIEGESPKGPLPLEEALRIAHQIADALEAAHEKGITHRDLKPGNIKIKPDGTVKVLDFGLAKVSSGSSGTGENSPTLTIGMTDAGMILGTASYMAPEQARAKEAVDKRTDIWAFGVVLYELITGKRLFTGEDVGEILAKVIRDEPDLSGLPPQVVPLLKRCLEKDPKKRLRDIGDWELLLVEQAPASVLEANAKQSKRHRVLWVVAALVAALAVAASLVSYRHFTEEAHILKFMVSLPEKTTIDPGMLPTVSPDGRHLAFGASTGGRSQVWVQDLDSLTSRAVPGTEGGRGPFWSPDSRYLAFGADGKLKKIDLSGGPAQILCEAVVLRGGSWGKSDVIVFSPATTGGLLRIPASGGVPTPVSTLDARMSESSHRWPWFLPDSHHFLYTAFSTDPKKTAVYVGDLDSKERKKVLTENSNAAYSPTGHLLFIRENTLMAQLFDAGKLQTSGEPVPIAETVDALPRNAQAQFGASQNGVLVYTSNPKAGNAELTWFDSAGKVTGTVGPPGQVAYPAISPDRRIVAFWRTDPQTGQSDVWLHDLARDSDSRFTTDTSASAGGAVWSPDGGHIAYWSIRNTGWNLYQKATSGATREEPLAIFQDQPAPRKSVSDWSRDGRYIVTRIGDPKEDDIWLLPLFGDRKPFPYVHSGFGESFGKLSPDGHWLAYGSNETKTTEVYVQSFPLPGRKFQISANGGDNPVWSRDGKQLFFVGRDQKMMAVDVNAGAVFEASLPKALFDTRLPRYSGFDVSPDGRFLVPMQVEDPGNVPLTVVVNWPAGLKR